MNTYSKFIGIAALVVAIGCRGMEEPSVVLVTANGVTFKVGQSLYNQLGTIKDQVEISGVGSEIPVSNVDSRQMDQLLKFLKIGSLGGDKIRLQELMSLLEVMDYLDVTLSDELKDRLVHVMRERFLDAVHQTSFAEALCQILELVLDPIRQSYRLEVIAESIRALDKIRKEEDKSADESLYFYMVGPEAQMELEMELHEQECKKEGQDPLFCPIFVEPNPSEIVIERMRVLRESLYEDYDKLVGILKAIYHQGLVESGLAMPEQEA